MQAALVIDQADIEFVAVGRPVTINIDELPGDRFSSKITEISKLDLKYSPRELSHKTGGELDTKTDAAGQERPMNTSYQALAPLDDDEEILRVGLRGRGKISASHWISLGGRAGAPSARHSISGCDRRVKYRLLTCAAPLACAIRAAHVK